MTARWVVFNQLTDNSLGVHDAATPREAIDKAYQAAGWGGFHDACVNRATAAEEWEIVAVRLDNQGEETGDWYGFNNEPAP